MLSHSDIIDDEIKSLLATLQDSETIKKGFQNRI